MSQTSRTYWRFSLHLIFSALIEGGVLLKTCFPFFTRAFLTDIVKLLVSNGEKVGRMTEDSKETPLHLSSANGHIGVVREKHTLANTVEITI